MKLQKIVFWRGAQFGRFPAGWLTGALALTCGVCAWLGWNALRSHQIHVATEAQAVRFEELRGVIVHRDEGLRMAARLAAETGDLHWEQPYRRFAAQLDAAITEMLQFLADERIFESAAQTAVANLKLVELEHRAFDCVRTGQTAAAQAVLFGAAYKEQERQYAAGMAAVMELIKARLITAGQAEWWRTQVSVAGALLAMLLWVHTVKTPLRDEQGACIGVLGIFWDITERRRAAEQMRLQAQALPAAANGIVITDRTGTIKWVNPAFTTLTGYPAAAAIGQNPHLLKSGRHGAAFYRQMWETILRGEVWRGEVTNQRRDGTLYIEEMTITPVRSQAGAITHFIAIKQDVTVRKQVERALVDSHRQLGEALAELRQTQRQVVQQERLRALGQMASGIAHDFNNALAPVLGFSELLLLNMPPVLTEPEKRRYLVLRQT